MNQRKHATEGEEQSPPQTNLNLHQLPSKSYLTNAQSIQAKKRQQSSKSKSSQIAMKGAYSAQGSQAAPQAPQATQNT